MRTGAAAWALIVLYFCAPFVLVVLATDARRGPWDGFWLGAGLASWLVAGAIFGWRFFRDLSARRARPARGPR
ncbi:MAG: hypothetical protein AAGC56_04935 [Pseudomonadota bacterium]